MREPRRTLEDSPPATSYGPIHMNSRTALLVAFLVVAIGAIWALNFKGSGAAEDTSQAERSAVGRGNASDPSLPAELEAPSETDAPGRESVPEGAEPESNTTLASEPLETWADEATVWLEATVTLPESTPHDESVHVVALSESKSAKVLYGKDGPFVAQREGREPRRVDGVLASSQVAPDGTVRLALPPGTAEAWLVAGGTYVYSSEPRRVVLSESPNGTTLRPALGALLVGQVIGPTSGAALADLEVSVDWSINAALQLGSADATPLDRSARVGNDGRFRFCAVPVGRPMTVGTEESPFARYFGEDLEPSPGERIDIAIHLQIGGTVRGRVVDEAGTAVAGADVEALGREFFGNPSADLRETKSDDEGRYVLEGLTPGRVWLKVEHDDYREKLGSPFDLADGEVLEAPDIVLDAGLAIAGIIKFPSDRPAVGAQVEIDPDLAENLSGSPMDPRAFAGADGDDVADEAGAFRITGVGEGPWTVTVELEVADEGQPEVSGRWTAFEALVRAPADDMAITLEAPVTLTGSVVDTSGQPVVEFTVKGSRSGSQWYMPPSETKNESFENEDGEFVLSELRSGDWTFTVTADGMARSEKLTLTLPTEETASFVLSRPIVLAGRVTDPDGEPIGGAEIGKELEGAEVIVAMQGRGDWPTTTTDDEGNFELEGVQPGAGSIVAKKDGWAQSEGFAYELAEGESARDIVLALRRGGTITGEVFDADGEPADGCMVIVQIPTLEERRFTNADASGRFEESGLMPGSYQVQAFPGITSFESEDGGGLDQMALMKALKMASVTLEDGKTEHVVLGSPPAEPVRLRGTVTLAGEPIADSIVSFVQSAGGGLEGLKITNTKEDGSFNLTLDAPGEYLVTVQSQGVPGMQNSVEFRRTIPGAEEHELTIEMPLGRITGHVVGPDGASAANTRVTLSMQSGQVFGTIMGGQYDETRTDAEGKYEIAYVRPGTYAIAAGGSYLGGMLGEEHGLGRMVKSIEVAKDGWETVDFQLEAPGHLHGIVRDAAGKPVADASIFVRDENGRLVELFSFQATNSSGKFEIDDLGPGEYTVTARTNVLASTTDTTVQVRSGETTEATVAVDTGTILLVSLSDSSGAPIRSRVSVIDSRGFEVTGMLSLTELMERISGGMDGTEQRVGPLPPGKYRVHAYAEDGRSVSKTARVSGQEKKKLKLRLR